MKKLMLILAVLCLALASAVLAAPNIVIYRYEGKGFIRDDAKWLADKKIALLVHGFPIFSQGKCRNGMIGLAAHLSHARKIDDVALPSYDVIYAVEYPAKYHILDTAAVLADIVNARCPSNTKIDVFAHSMGGLVVRTAIEYPEVLLGTKAITVRVNHLVTMGTPHHGLGVAEIEIFKEALGQIPAEIGDMDTDGQFLNMLNFTSSKKPQVSCEYYSIVGARSYRPKKYSKDKTGPFATILMKIQDINHPVHDGLIDATSAGYDLTEVCHTFKKAQLDLNHDYIKSHPEVFSTIDRWMIEDKWFDIALAKTESQPKVVSSIHVPQILLGKTRAEIEGILGDTVLYWDIVRRVFIRKDLYKGVLGYYYPYMPSEKYNNTVSFLPINESYYPERKYNQTHSVSISFWPGIERISEASSPDRIVLAEILNAKPSHIYRSVMENTVAVVWYIKHRTFLLLLKDVPSRPLYTTVKINGRKSKYVVNKNTTDFRQGHVYHFAYADKIIKIERFLTMYGEGYCYHFYINCAAQSGLSGYLFDK